MMQASRIAVAAAGALVVLVLGGPAGAEHGTPGTAQLISRASGLAAVPAATTNNSYLHENPSDLFDSAGRTISGDGRYIVFESDADGLSPADNNSVRNIFVRDRTGNTTTLVSRAATSSGVPADGDSYEATISQDGSTVAFLTRATNLGDGAPSNNNFKVYVRTVATGALKFVSRQAGLNGAAAGFSAEPSLNADGSKVAFESFTSLDAADTNTSADIYVRTVSDGSMALASRVDGVSGAVGDSESRSPSLSGDGSRVAFRSSSTNLVTGDTNNRRDIFVRDLGAGTTVLASRATTAGGAIGNQDSYLPSLSADGTKVAFITQATNFGFPNGGADVFVRDLSAGTTTLASRKDGAAGAEDAVANIFQAPAISYDGTTVAFTAGGTNVEPGVSPTWFSVYVRVLATNSTRIASRANGSGTPVPADGLSGGPSLNLDGTLVVFDSVARNLGTDADPEFRGVYLRDMGVAATTTSIARPDGTAPLAAAGLNTSDSIPAGVSSDGRYVVFTSKADWLSGDDDNALNNVFVRDTVTDTTTLVSRASGASGAAANGNSVAGGISADGTKVVFESAGNNLHAGETLAEVYVRDLTTNQTILVTPLNSNSAGLDTADSTTMSSRARISADGTKVVFQTSGQLDPADILSFSVDAYVANADGTGSVVWVNRTDGAAGTGGNGISLPDGISADGSRVAFDSTSSNIDPADANTNTDAYVRDLTTNDTILVSRANGAAGPVGDSQSQGGDISADGNRVPFMSFSSNLVSPPLSNAGQIYVRDLAAGTTVLVSRAEGPTGAEGAGNPQQQPAISADGQRVVFAYAGFIGTFANPKFTIQVFVRDLGTNVTTLVSHASGNANSSGNQLADHPAISGNGDCVAFQSSASDLVPAFSGGSDFFNVYLGTVARECPVVLPDTAITSGPTGTINTRTPTFTFTSDDGTATFECQLDGAAFAGCATPYTTPSLADGSHTLTVRAVDPATYRDPSPPSRTFAVDATAPETTIQSGPGGSTSARSASFTFVATETATFACSLDGGAAVACTSPASYSGLAEGSHTFTVAATDGLGNSDPTPAARAWTVDTTAPDTLIATGPAARVRSRLASLTFSSEAGATFRCSLDGAAAAACSSPASYPGLKDARHTFTVSAVDAAGNVDASPASRAWTVDATAPKASLALPKQRLGTAVARGLRLTLKTNEAGRFTLTLVYKGKTIGTTTVSAKRAGTTTRVLRLNAKGKKALRAARSASLTARLTGKDSLGNTSRSSKRFTLKR